ncbi:hypothetical protein BDN72DRAFT_842144 [Pluteus cervinus]|uniref:Uncharacterized protein n=1 Tax=Pluteus cervinus TaxID=181527 RepID=A0ACD3AQR9_9AGAR|nr:hypothetical protein BDN72DRAFT_842144 [Pluteus cervinus]
MSDTQSSTPLDATPTTLNSLPNELLIKILEYLDDDLDLYRQSSVCRSLHHSALGVLFRRYDLEHKLARGSLSLTRQSPFILRCITSALFLNDFPKVSIQFDLDITKMLSELRMVKSIVSRSHRNEILVLKFSKMATMKWMASDHETPPRDFEEFTELLQGVVDAALERGCCYLMVESQSDSGYTHRPSTPSTSGAGIGNGIVAGPSTLSQTQRQVEGTQSTQVPPVPKKRRFTLFRQLRRTLSLKGKRKSVLEDSATPVSITNPSEEEPLSTRVQNSLDSDSPGSRVRRYSRAMQTKGTFNILAEVLLEPTWLDWTLPILNHSPITTLKIDTHHFSSSSSWNLSLPKIQMGHLESFELLGPKIDLNRVAIFLRQHATTLNKVILKFDSHSSESFIPTSNVMDVDFPKITYLALTPCCTPWFFNGATETSLPKLWTFEIASPTGGHFFHQVDESLKAISSFATLALAANSPSSPTDPIYPPGIYEPEADSEPKRKWLGVLSIEFMSSLGIVSWLKTHTKDPSVSPLNLIKLPTISELSLFPTTLESADNELFEHMPKFLGIFPGLQRLGVGVREEVAKQALELEKGYWMGVKKGCPLLEVVRFLSKSGAVGADEELVTVLVEDLLNGKAESLGSGSK